MRLAGILGATAVALGAFGAHGLKSLPHIVADPSLLTTWETAARYHLVMAAVMAALAGRRVRWARRLLLSGLAVFSGSLYTLVLTEQRWLGAVTPLGGALMIAGFVSLAVRGERPEGT
ncbi:MAG: hypothetical protein RLZZ383_1454 [Pseudomonadota bacterium]|jgi:uncharacterized membrane protein YgdD (TMEM256/DUF423 family)